MKIQIISFHSLTICILPKKGSLRTTKAEYATLNQYFSITTG